MIKNLIRKNDVNSLVRQLKKNGNIIIFTNGVFDIIHRGHIDYLSKAKAYGDVLIVGLNTDASVRRFKGNMRPINKQNDRAIVLLALKMIDYVVFFGEDRPDKLIRMIKPDLLVKGADYKINEIAGADFVKSYGGKVKRIKLTKGYSTSNIIKDLC
ncbi:MAG: D-glycero-beta-D-manno-heptose 1-phosphate adenylyltransferase [Candidatus Zixiibacteriota bacterium]